MYYLEKNQINQQTHIKTVKKTKEFKKKVTELEIKLNNIIKENKKNNNEEISRIDRKLIYIKYEIDNLFIDSEERYYTDFKTDKKNQLQLSGLIDRIKLLQEKIQNYQSKKLLKIETDELNSIGFISLIELIFSPLAFITGFYGMNFFSMGLQTRAEAKSKSIYGLHHNYIIFCMVTFAFLLFLIWYLHKNYNNKISGYLRNLTKKSEKSLILPFKALQKGPIAC